MRIVIQVSAAWDAELRVRTSEIELAAVWARFTRKFATEADCVEELYRRALDAGAVECKKCRGSDLVWVTGTRTLRCRQCNRLSWFTADTFFRRVRLVRPWLAAIWLLEHGVSISSLRFHRLVNIAYSTAWNIFRKLAMVMARQACAGAVAVQSALFTTIFSRRSRETPARAHPRAEQDEIEREYAEGGPLANDGLGGEIVIEPLSEQPGVNHGPADAESHIYQLLSNEPIHFDALLSRCRLSAGELSATLTMLELDGRVSTLFGGWFARVTANVKPSGTTAAVGGPLDHAIEEIVEILTYIRIVFHGISRKYLRSYLAVHWCWADRERWRRGGLMLACLASAPVSENDVLESATPAVVDVYARSFSARPAP